jgi:hypothetical protein
MRKKTYTQGITIFTTPEMYQAVKEVSDEQEISLGEFFRKMITEHFRCSTGSQKQAIHEVRETRKDGEESHHE